MPFSSTASLTSTDANNMLRGLYRDNADHALTGTVTETDLASTSITANTIGATGCMFMLAAGTITGTAGNRTFRLYWGGSVLTTLTVLAANNDNWSFEMWLHNTATNAQRICFRFTSANSGTGVVTNHIFAYSTSAKDTTANQTLKISGQLANTGDTITETMFDVLVCQIT